MLDLFRKNTKLIVWAVIGSFILWGGFSVGTSFKKEGNYAGSVFGKNVSFQEFDRFYKASQLFSFGGKEIKDPEVLRQTAWQGIVFSREAKNQKIDVSDHEVRQQILKLLDAQKVNRDNYLAWLDQAIHETPQQFEEQVREVVRIQKLFEKLEGPESSFTATAEEAKKQFLSESDKISAEFAQLPSKSEADALRDRLRTPEDWEKEKSKKPEIFKQTGSLPVDALVNILQMDPVKSAGLLALEKGHFSEVIPLGRDSAVFFVAEREKGDEKKFEAEKETYISNLTEQKKQALLLQKSQEILNRAKLQDFSPAPKSTPAP